MHQRTFGRIAPARARALFYLLFLVSLFLIWRLYQLQVMRGPVLAKEAFEQRADTVEIFARRGSILDRDGNVLVRSLPSQSIYANPSQISDAALTAQKLATVLGPLHPGLRSELADRHVQFVWIARKVSHDVAQRIAAQKLDGIDFKEEDTGRRYDMVGHLASSVLGFVGIDENGLDGVEYSFDAQLRGTPGKMLTETDGLDHAIPFGQQSIVKPAKPGYNLQLTLDSYLQYQTERALAQQVHKYSAQSGSAIVMDPNTGEVLAMANQPDYEPNSFAKYSDAARHNGAVMDTYEPGSTFKLVTAAAALESHKVSPDMRFPARDSLTVGGYTIHNAEDGAMGLTGSSENLGQIIEYSHNVGAAEVGMAIGKTTLFNMISAAGFGEPTDVGLPGESPGIVPAPANWSDTTLPTVSFGQGISVTPISLIRFYCAIANGGMLLRPRILSAVTDQEGNVVYRYRPEVERRIFSERTARILRGYLRTVVLHGTGNPNAQILGYATAGKTGTAQVVENGVYASGQYVASFIGMVPADHPRYVILMKVARPRGAIYGGDVAAPGFSKIAEAAMLHAGVLPSVTPSPPPRPLAASGERLVRSKSKKN